MEYKPLEPVFQRNGFRFKQIVREGDLAIYHKVHLSPAHDSGFEVIQIGRHDGYELAGNKIEPAETFPSNEQWGSKGFSYPDLFHAELRFERMKNGDMVASAQLGDPTPEQEETDAPAEPKATRRPRGSGLPEVTFPEGEFSIKEAAALNPSINPSVVYLCVKAAEEAGTVKRTRTERRAEKGKPTQLFQKNG